ncbi:hypothetical protein BT69DRAFT_1349529 [Atractiella rhizophila]|nr:hypothetical protein BT69DRAFT_1349529 [Atractiella rhizophila]
MGPFTNKPQSAPTQSTSSQQFIIPKEYEQYTLPQPAQKRPSHSLLFTREEFKKWRSQFQKLSAEGRAGKKYEWLRDFNGVEVPQQRVMDIKREAREILDAMYDGPLHQRKTWHQILHSHHIRGVAVLESKFPELTQCQGHAMADHILTECRHRQLERYRAGDRCREKRLKVKEDEEKHMLQRFGVDELFPNVEQSRFLRFNNFVRYVICFAFTWLCNIKAYAFWCPLERFYTDPQFLVALFDQFFFIYQRQNFIAHRNNPEGFLERLGRAAVLKRRQRTAARRIEYLDSLSSSKIARNKREGITRVIGMTDATSDDEKQLDVSDDNEDETLGWDSEVDEEDDMDVDDHFETWSGDSKEEEEEADDWRERRNLFV